jgi:hypothetical protein
VEDAVRLGGDQGCCVNLRRIERDRDERRPVQRPVVEPVAGLRIVDLVDADDVDAGERTGPAPCAGQRNRSVGRHENPFAELGTELAQAVDRNRGLVDDGLATLAVGADLVRYLDRDGRRGREPTLDEGYLRLDVALVSEVDVRQRTRSLYHEVGDRLDHELARFDEVPDDGRQTRLERRAFLGDRRDRVVGSRQDPSEATELEASVGRLRGRE